VQTFTAPISGDYKLEVWGAEGGIGGRSRGDAAPENAHGGLGGYAIGYITLINGTDLYVCVGGKGENAPNDPYTSTYVPRGGKGGYNGGGDGGSAGADAYGTGFIYLRGGGGGGGATHVANINKGILSNYLDSRDNILIVAGGGGGFMDNGYLLGSVEYYSGGGESGAGDKYAGGTQTTGYAFGQGAKALDEPTHFGAGIGEGDGGGGGGWYGGYACSISMDGNNGCGGGGSGHINTSLITNGSMLNARRLGDGYCIITWQQLP